MPQTGRIAVCPGSFDPVTNGHLDIIRRAADRYEEVIVALLPNGTKKGLLPVEDRADLVRKVTADLPSVRVAVFQGLLADFCAQEGISTIVRSLRSVTDFVYEMQIAQMNRVLSGVETIFLVAEPQYSFLSSSIVKEIASHGGNVSELVPPVVEDRLRKRFDELAADAK